MQQTVAGRFTDRNTGEFDWMRLAQTATQNALGSDLLADCKQDDGSLDLSRAGAKLSTLGARFTREMEGREKMTLADAGNLVLDNLDWLVSEADGGGSGGGAAGRGRGAVGTQRRQQRQPPLPPGEREMRADMELD